MKDAGRWVEEKIAEFLNSSENRLFETTDEPAWGAALVGYSSGADPLYGKIKEDIGDFYWTPLEIWKKTFPVGLVEPSDLTVISWILPQTSATKKDNRTQKRYPSERWARARKKGEEVQGRLRAYIVNALRVAGIDALAACRFALLRADDVAALRTCLHMVGKACSSRGRSRYLRVVRRSYHAGREGHALRLCHRPHSNSSFTQALR